MRVIAASVNGRIEAVGYTFDDGLGRGVGYSILLPPDSLKKGYNRVELFLVEEDGKKLQLLYRGPDDPDAGAANGRQETGRVAVRRWVLRSR